MGGERETLVPVQLKPEILSGQTEEILETLRDSNLEGLFSVVRFLSTNHSYLGKQVMVLQFSYKLEKVIF